MLFASQLSIIESNCGKVATKKHLYSTLFHSLNLIACNNMYSYVATSPRSFNFTCFSDMQTYLIAYLTPARLIAILFYCNYGWQSHILNKHDDGLDGGCSIAKIRKYSCRYDWEGNRNINIMGICFRTNMQSLCVWLCSQSASIPSNTTIPSSILSSIRYL